jgi:hypothetical protein
MKAGKRVTLKVKKLGKRTHMRSKPRKSTSRKSTSRKSTSRKSTSRKSTSRKSKKSTSRNSTSRKSTSRKSTSRKSTSRKSTSRKSTSRKSTSRKSKKSTSRNSTSRKSKKQTRGGRPVEEKEQKEDTSDEETETDEEEIEEESYVMPPREGAGDPMDEILNEPQSEMDRDIENYLQAEHFLHDLYGVPSSDTATPAQRLNSMFPPVPTHRLEIREPLEDLPVPSGVEMREPDDLPSMPEIRRRLAALRDGPDEPEDPEPAPLPSYEDGPNPMTEEELPSYDAVMNEDEEVMNEDDDMDN